jgi:hypothetical protein
MCEITREVKRCFGRIRVLVLTEQASGQGGDILSRMWSPDHGDSDAPPKRLRSWWRWEWADCGVLLGRLRLGSSEGLLRYHLSPAPVSVATATFCLTLHFPLCIGSDCAELQSHNRDSFSPTSSPNRIITPRLGPAPHV